MKQSIFRLKEDFLLCPKCESVLHIDNIKIDNERMIPSIEISYTCENEHEGKISLVTTRGMTFVNHEEHNIKKQNKEK